MPWGLCTSTPWHPRDQPPAPCRRVPAWPGQRVSGRCLPGSAHPGSACPAGSGPPRRRGLEDAAALAGPGGAAAGSCCPGQGAGARYGCWGAKEGLGEAGWGSCFLNAEGSSWCWGCQVLPLGTQTHNSDCGAGLVGAGTTHPAGAWHGWSTSPSPSKEAWRLEGAGWLQTGCPCAMGAQLSWWTRAAERDWSERRGLQWLCVAHWRGQTP